MPNPDPAATQSARKPPWIRVRLPSGCAGQSTRETLTDLRLTTVCEQAQCPNLGECWSRATATVMIGGRQCTRACPFCAVETARPLPLEPDEPHRVALAAERLRLRHVVVTGVERDDLPDGGSAHFATTVHAIRTRCPGVTVEVLVPDFGGDTDAVWRVVDSGPRVFNHNLETVERLTPTVRHRARYALSLEVLRLAAERAPHILTKSGIMVGFGETEAEVGRTMDDLRGVGVRLLTLGQYLRPSPRHLPVTEYVEPARFAAYAEMARARGFTHASCAPMVRSSYCAGDAASAAL